jgi:LysM repeat protein
MSRRMIVIVIFFFSAAIVAWSEPGVYTVRKGDTLSRISRESGVSVNVLKSFNQLNDASSLEVGMKIRIPDVHVVKKGDTLYSLGRRYGISVDELIAANRLKKGQALKLEQKLYVPSGRTIDKTAIASSNQADKTRIEKNSVPEVKTTVFWPHPGAREVYDGKMRGIVINGDKGDLVYSVSLGRVIWANPYRGFGNVVLVSGDNDLVYGYMGIEELVVSVGEKIESGSALGRMGVYFHQTDAKLLFIVYDNDKRVYLDPRAVLLAGTQARE